MTCFPRLTFAALLALGLHAAPASAQNADRVNTPDPALQAAQEAFPDAEARRGGFRSGRFHGARFRGARFHHRSVHVARHHAPRPHWRRHYHGPRFIAPVYPYGCIRRGWVWNGWQYVWRRYRVC